MRWMPVYLGGAAVLAALHVAGVLIAAPPLPPAEVGTFLLLLAYAGTPPAVAGTRRFAVAWLVPVALLPLLVEALLTIPSRPDGGYGWQILTPGDLRLPNPVLLALSTGFETAGPPLLLAGTLLAVTIHAVRRVPPGPRRPLAALGLFPAAAVAGYAAVRVLRVADAAKPRFDVPGRTGNVLALLLAVAVPVLLAVVASTLLTVALRAGRPRVALGALLLTLSTLPVVDAAIAAVPQPYAAYRSAGEGIFGWAAVTPSVAMPAPVPAITLATQLIAYFLLVTALTRVPRSVAG